MSSEICRSFGLGRAGGVGRSSGGFTLVELAVLLCCAVAGLALLLAVVQQVRASTAEQTCATHQRMMYMAVKAHAADHNDYGPTQPTDEWPHYARDLDPYLGYQGQTLVKPENFEEGFYDTLRQANGHKIWFVDTGCPSFVGTSVHFQTAFTINTNFFGEAEKRRGINKLRHPLSKAADPANTMMWSDGLASFLPPGDIAYYRTRVIEFRGVPRHGGLGVNFTFFDGHGEFRTFNASIGDKGGFEPGNPFFGPVREEAPE
jgi:prepilin-type processing-associated H-X9-DG protein